MLLRTLPIADLKPAPYNPRRPLKPGSPGWKRLERSLREFDLVQPIVWNEATGHVVGGHQRLEILKHQGQTTVDAVVVNLALEREKALNIALNNSQVGSDWDAERLTEVLDELASVPDFDITMTGFDDRDIRDFLLAPADNAAVATDSGEKPVRVTLDIPRRHWDHARPEIDDLAETYECRLHVDS